MHLYRHAHDNSPLPHKKIKFWYVYLIAVVFNFHTLLVSYITPTYLVDYLNATHIGILYGIASFGSLIFFLVLPFFLKRFGNVLVTIGLMTLCIMTLVLVGGAFSPLLVILACALFLIINPLLYLNIDIFSETLIGKNEGATGHIRGLTLSLMSLAALCAPLSISFLVGSGDNLSQLFYIAIGVAAVFILIVINNFRTFIDPPYHKIHLKPLIRQCLQTKALRLVLSAHFILQIFFTWTVLYIPLYLASVIGLPWSSIGAIIASGILAYVLCEYPIGIVADNYFGEKEMMAIGFLILAVTAASISFFSAATPLIGWMILMFMSRTGASLAEVTTESYFFKKVDGGDANLMSMFRLTRPLAVLVGSLLGSACLLIMPFNLAFIVLGFVMVIGMLITFGIEDTK